MKAFLLFQQRVVGCLNFDCKGACRAGLARDSQLAIRACALLF